MEKPKQMKVARRLLVGQGLLITIFLLFGVFTIYNIHTLTGLTRTLYDHPLTVSNAALQANVAILKMQRGMKDAVLVDTPQRIRNSIEAVNQLEQVAYQHFDIVRQRILGDEGRQFEKDARILFDAWRPIRAEVISLVLNGQRDRAVRITAGADAEHVAKLEKEVFGLTRYARDKATVFMRETEKTHARANTILVLLLLFSACAVSLIAFFTFKQTTAAEKELVESRQLLVNAIDLAPIGMAMVEPGGKFYTGNHEFSQMVGYSKEELCHLTFQDITHPDDYDAGSELVNRVLSGEIDRGSLEKRYVTKDGSIINVWLTTSLLRDKDGEPQYFFTQIQDITERKLDGQRIEHLNRVLRSIRDVNQLIVRERDPDTLINEGCRLLVDNRGYNSALIVLTDENDRPFSWAGSGSAIFSESLDAMRESDELPPCCDIRL